MYLQKGSPKNLSIPQFFLFSLYVEIVISRIQEHKSCLSLLGNMSIWHEDRFKTHFTQIEFPWQYFFLDNMYHFICWDITKLSQKTGKKATFLNSLFR